MKPASQWQRIRAEGRLESLSKGKTTRVKLDAVEYGSFVNGTVFVSRGRLASCPVALFLDFSVRDVTVSIASRHCIEFQTREVEDCVLVDSSGAHTSLFLTLKHPARVYDRVDPHEELEFTSRVSHICVSDTEALSKEVLAFCRTVRLVFGAGQEALMQTVLDFCGAVEKVLYDAEVKVVVPERELKIPLEIEEKTRHSGSWEVRLAWLCLTSAAGFVAERFTDVFFQRLDDCTERLAVSMLYGMSRLMQQDFFLDPLVAFDEAVKRGFVTKDVEDPELHCRVARLILTPTRMVFYEPEIIQTNRVLREWGSKSQFLRVAIRDDNFSRLSTSRGKLDRVLGQIVTLMNGDLHIGGRVFKFLGCSNNQVRDHGCFFVDSTENEKLVWEIRSWAGNLDRITNVAKYVARLGQVFSTSTNTVTVDVAECARIPDLAENGYCFSDGIGKITPDLAEEVALKLGTTGIVPCAFQIRFGGCKGVVAVDLNISKEYPGKRMFFRESMLKYWSSHRTIEVLSSCARPQELFLNQQLIMLLSYRGVPDSVFVRLLKESVTSLSKMFTEEDVARKKLKSVQCGIDWEVLEESNFLVTTDPYLRSMLMALYRLQMKGLREKSRIPIDTDDARVLIGTVDESLTLEYGQVFIQISKYLQNPGVEKTVLERKVVIAKSPCLHPGDLRTFEAVDCPALHHMCDCVVFPGKGKRPHPNELSGSDLDGDLYHVLWGEYLLPTKPIQEPMHYGSTKSLPQLETVQSKDMLTFLRQNIEHDCLGQIDNTHKALADQLGVDSEACIRLAHLHSQAVDAPKTGQWANVPRNIRKMLDKYPDFMMKQDRPSYPSEKVLGIMYRECTKFLNTCSIHKTTFNTFEVALNQGMGSLEGIECFLEEARRLRKQYNGKMRALMAMYGVMTEAEFMSGFVERLHEKIGKEKMDISTLLGNLRKKLVEKYRDIFIKDAKICTLGVADEEKALCKAAAWYHVCYSPTEPCERYEVGKTEARFLSFAWIASGYLMKWFKKANCLETVSGAKERIGRSIYDLLEDSIRRLLHCFEEQLLVKEYVKTALEKSDAMFLPFLYGTSYTLLSDERTPETELVLWFSGLDGHLARLMRLDATTEKEMTHSVRRRLQDSGIECKPSQCGRRALVHFGCYIESLNHRVRGHVALDPFYWFQSALLLEYMYHNPWLLPLLRVVVKWARATEFVSSLNNALIDSLSICFMLLDYCLRKDLIADVNADAILENLRQGQFECHARSDVWTEMTGRLFSEAPEGAPLGDVLLGFFSDHEHNTVNAIHPKLQSAMGQTYYHQVCSIETMKLLEQEMQRAFHKLSFHCSIQPLFQNVETEKVIHIPVQHAERMRGSEPFFARLYSKQTRSTVEVHQRGDRAGGLLLKITGSNTAIHSVERHVDQFKARSEALDVTLKMFPGPMELFVEGSQQFIIEGIDDFCEKRLILEDYWGARYPEDDNRGLYVIRVINPSEPVPQTMYDLASEKFIHFRDFFINRLQMMTEEGHYSAFVHGPLSLEISYGKLYLLCPTKEMNEDPEGVSLSQLVQHMRKGPKHFITQPYNKWMDQMESQSENPDSASNRLRMSFFPKLHPAISEASLETWTQQYGLNLVHREDKYVLCLRGQRHGIVAEYDSDMTLNAVSYPSVHWMIVDVKRFYRERTEMDVRFDLASRASCKADPILRKVSNGIYKKHPRGADSTNVAPQLIPVVESLKHIRSKEFIFEDSSPEATGFWRRTRIRINDVTATSRPRQRAVPEFGMKERFFDLRFVVDLGEFASRTPSDPFIKEMWYQTMFLSDRLSDMAGGAVV